tara:strand:- start:441 stop:1529 length:1089 start_codon:yes stop_codon:yes gene_type:complete
MSNEVQNEDVVEDQLQDEIVDEVNEESVEEAYGSHKGKKKMPEMAAAPEVDGEKAAATDAKAAKASAPAKAAEPKAGQGKPTPMTKVAMINAMFTKMSGMSKDEMKKMHNSYHPEGVQVEGEAMVENSFDEDLNALVETEATLSDGFRAKAEVIFEAAVNAKVTDHVNKLDEQFKDELAEETQRIHSEVVDKVDGYLNYVVEKWMEDNKLAIEGGLRTEISESFIKALHGVFNEHYVDVPDAKVDLVDELAKKNDDLEDQLSSAMEDNIKLKESNAELSKDSIIRETASDLSEAQTEKLKKLAESTAYDSADDYRQKIETLKESYFKKATEAKPTETVELDESAETPAVSDRMSAYLSALKQ